MNRNRSGLQKVFIFSAVIFSLTALPIFAAVAETGVLTLVNQLRRRDSKPELQTDRNLARAADGLARRLVEQGPNAIRPQWLDQEMDAAGYRWRLRHLAHGVNYPDARSFTEALKTRDMGRRILSSPLPLDFAVAHHQADERLQQRGVRNIWVAIAALPDRAAPAGWREDVLVEVNRFRRLHALPDLVLNERLNRAAQAHADDMAVKDYFAHRAPDGSGPGERAWRYRYRYEIVLENLAAGQSTPRGVVEGWKASTEGHREAMLDPRPVEVGIGYRYHPTDKGRARYFHYWAMTMGRPGG